MINSVTNVTPALAGWFDPGQARQQEACLEDKANCQVRKIHPQ
jgi:hypothetical protein